MSINSRYNICKSLSENILRKTLEKKIRSIVEDEYGPIFSTPVYMELLLEILRKEKLDKNSNIIDLGSSISPILLYLAMEGYTNLHGVDKDGASIDFLSGIGRINGYTKNLRLPDNELQRLTEAARLIYIYKPIYDRTIYKDTLTWIADSMTIGAIIADFSTPDLLREISDDTTVYALKERPVITEKFTSAYFVKDSY